MSVKPVRRIKVVPSVPENLQHLIEIAQNLWWCWDADAIQLFRRIDDDLWEEVYHNPIRMLGRVAQEQFDNLSTSGTYLAHLERVYSRLQNYMSRETWHQHSYDSLQDWKIAYFCAEYGITESLRIYSGGLGILAGDHLKSASDMGLPLVAVGLSYQLGYFRQYLNADGWQGEDYPENNFTTLPLHLERGSDGQPLRVQVEHPMGALRAQIWRAQVGRVPLYLLDANIPENPEYLRGITSQLYGGDQEMRIQQELLLGVGGLRALEQLGHQPTSYHINEGHSAFLVLERIRRLMHEHGLNFDEAREATFIGHLFTTHTSVPAGIDIFPQYLIEKYLRPMQESIGISMDDLLTLGRQYPDNSQEGFNMAVLALRQSLYRNGVSKLHGVVSRRMWQTLWPNVPEHEAPIRSITNGIHIPSWLSHDMGELFDRYIGPDWRDSPQDASVWEAIMEVPPTELWRTHERRRERLVSFVRNRLRLQLEQRGASSIEVARASEILDPEALTIGFARRFATYKRATLLLTDLERLVRILGSTEKPVQIIFAGKAHPRDDGGKELIRSIVHQIQHPDFRNRMVFLENYDACIARYLVSGVDVWLNNPRRLMEASGTSGMKASVNGALNISTLDGWWDEIYDPELGWAIGKVDEGTGNQDRLEAEALYTLLEEDIVPTFYERGKDGLPRRWIERMRKSMRVLCPLFNTHRMLDEYADQCYLSSHHYWKRRAANDFAVAKEIAAWKKNIRQHWPDVSVQEILDESTPQARVGEQITVRVRVALGHLTPADVAVELYQGRINAQGELTEAEPSQMECAESQGDGIHTYVATLQLADSGDYGYTVRILPDHVELCGPGELALVSWLQP